ncbi:hypothetical protein M8C21_017580 [Ambrosia artemisiifolia]|uniref:Uncharacterized protein n=1 Tax=Ambrosia artemisiifolia TaxID=4212 RepID=A0AAD5GM41_AMBAR|nr:hypothetical protein M8C21_017580 [Ambrosia artemisiifolia]
MFLNLTRSITLAIISIIRFVICRPTMFLFHALFISTTIMIFSLPKRLSLRLQILGNGRLVWGRQRMV